MDNLIRPLVEGYVEIRDLETGETLVSKSNRIHAENFSEAIALSLSNRSNGHIHEMVFGNGASTTSGTGAITYFPPNVVEQDAALYNQTYRKVIDDQSPLNLDKTKNKIRVSHLSGQIYTDIIITCTLDYSEPSGQEAFGDATDNEGNFVFDEIGLKSFDSVPGQGKLLSHVVFHPVLKALDRSIEVIYTIRVYMT